jgi:hypothetical protein
MVTLLSTATCSAFTAREAKTGVKISTKSLVERAGWALDLADEMGMTLLQECWDEEHLARLAKGVDGQGRKLPSKGYVALRRLGWRVVPPDGVRVNDRFLRVVEENVARSLRLTLHRKVILEEVLKTWPKTHKRSSEDWAALWAMLPPGTTKVEVRNRTRQVLAFMAANGRLPAGLVELEESPKLGRILNLAAADKQLVKMERQGQMAELSVSLPACPRPGSHADWSWLCLKINLPVTVTPSATLHTPSLRIKQGQIRVDLPFEVEVTPPALKGHAVALGLDWGVNTLLVGSVAKLVKGRVVTDGKPLRLQATGGALKLTRLRIQREHLAVKIAHLEKLLEGLPTTDPAAVLLTAQIAQMEVAKDQVCSRSRNLSHALGWQAGRWAVNQALARAATVIYVEDLATLEAQGMGRKQNARISTSVRSEIFAALTHLATKVGLAVVSVPARGTSKGCPRCTRALRHVASPDRLLSPGRGRWAYCPHCHLGLDRDHAGSQRIVGRGLGSQAHTFKNRASKLTIGSSIDTPVARCLRSRVKHLATPARKHVRQFILMPLRRENPSLVAVATSQRPLGQAPEVNRSSEGQVLTAFDYRLVHRVRWTGLGFGFHRLVQGSSIIQRGDWGLKDQRATPECRVA